ncbi:MAG: T9SS type A sorting domain-containing protein [Taibaiella sp.]|nr:T9SS type A sorting domain-containing protein [Taibaiella sp.]
MRRLVYLFALPLLFQANTVEAQSFSAQKDTSVATAYAYIDINNYITNNTSDTISVKWRIISETLPQSWKDNASFGLCDNVTCYDKAIFSGSVQTSDTFGAGKNMLYKVQLDVSPATVAPSVGSTPYYITTELTSGTTIDTVTFAVYKWNTNNISKVAVVREEVVVYPNPAYNEVNVTFNREMGVKNVAIYNLVGKQVSAYRVNGTSAKLDIEKIPAGIYFLRMMDSNGRVVATRRFTHQ